MYGTCAGEALEDESDFEEEEDDDDEDGGDDDDGQYPVLDPFGWSGTFGTTKYHIYT